MMKDSEDPEITVLMSQRHQQKAENSIGSQGISTKAFGLITYHLGSLLCLVILIIFLNIFFFYSNDKQNAVQTNSKSKLSFQGTSLLKKVVAQQKAIPAKDIFNHPIQKQHNHPVHPLTYSSLGIPNIGDLFNFTKVCTKDFGGYQRKLDGLFKPFNDTNCELAMFGKANGESYVLCKNFVKKSQALINIGLEGKDSFGCQINKLGVTNYLYDCKRNFQPSKCGTKQAGTIFQRKCFGDEIQMVEDYNYTLLNKQIDRKQLGEKGIILKLNEGNEWSILRYLPVQYLQKIDQLILYVYLPLQDDKKVACWGNINIIETLKQHFVSVYLHMNNNYRIKIQQMKQQSRLYPCGAFSVTLVNKRLIKIISETRSHRQQIVNLQSNPELDDIQMKVQ